MGADRTISIHAPRTGSDKGKGTSPSPIRTFQSTLPARGATGLAQNIKPEQLISIHAPRTGSDAIPYIDKLVNSKISIHAPRTGSDGSQYSPHP